MRKLVFLVNSAHADVTRDAAKQTVTDSQTTLQWEDNIANKDKKMTQPAAVKYCINLSFAGHDDWRLPKLKELEDLAKATKVKFPKKPILKNLPTFGGVFWTSHVSIVNKHIKFAPGSADATGVKFDTFDYGKRQNAIQRLEYSVRCVRSIK